MSQKMDEQRSRRKARVRKKVFGTAEVPRLSVFRSSKHIYAQIIDDEKGVTMVTVGSAGRETSKDSGNIKGAKKIGEMVAEKAKAKKITAVVFDRNGFKYHGRVKALADSAREKGLKF